MPEFLVDASQDVPARLLRIWAFERIRPGLFNAWIRLVEPNISELVKVDRKRWPVSDRYKAVEALREAGRELPLYASVEEAQKALKKRK